MQFDFHGYGCMGLSSSSDMIRSEAIWQLNLIVSLLDYISWQQCYRDSAQTRRAGVLQVGLSYLISAQQDSLFGFLNLLPELPYCVGCMLLILGVYLVTENERPEPWHLSEGRCPFHLVPLKIFLKWDNVSAWSYSVLFGGREENTLI